MHKESEFRFWLRHMWLDNCREHEEFNTLPYPSLQAYFQTYKFWLKREFRFQRRNNNA
jgi:CRISPR/Cas system-associated endonuclease Cas1